MDAIRLESVNFSYNETPLLEDINVSIKEKEIVTLIGPNGSGKTTLLKLILGLLKADKGKILIKGKLPHQAQKLMGYVPQYGFFDRKFPITVFEVVLSGKIKPFGFYSRSDKEEAAAALEEVGLSHKKEESFSRISGGQQQRMLIARALLSQTEILLMDEPTANIDSEAEKQLHRLLEKLGKKLTIILATHDTSFVSDITQRVLCVNHKLVEHPIDEHLNDIIASAYGSSSKIVRHEKIITSQNQVLHHD